MATSLISNRANSYSRARPNSKAHVATGKKVRRRRYCARLSPRRFRRSGLSLTNWPICWARCTHLTVLSTTVALAVLLRWHTNREVARRFSVTAAAYCQTELTFRFVLVTTCAQPTHIFIPRALSRSPTTQRSVLAAPVLCTQTLETVRQSLMPEPTIRSRQIHPSH